MTRVFAAVMTLLAAVAAGGDISLAPLFEIAGGHRRALGPFYEAGEDFQAVRPLWYGQGDNEAGFTDILWPVYTHEWQGVDHLRFGFFHLWEFSDPDITTEAEAEQDYIIPFWYRGRTAEGDDYAAVWPFGGTARSVFGIDRVQFVLWPVYSELWRDDAHTVSWFWPIYSRTEADGYEKQRVFPFWGYRLDYGKRVQRFYLWPIIHTWESLDPERPGHGTFVLPLVGHTEAEDSRGWTFLWPFFSGQTTTNASKLSAPWPFYVRWEGVRGEDSRGRHYWPVYGGYNAPGRSYRYVIWPIGNFWAEHTDARRAKTTSIVPVWYHRVVEPVDGPPHSRGRLWPLARWERQQDRERFAALALWPLPDYEPVERNWAPLWTLYTSERRDDTRERELLWGFWQYRREADRVARQRLFLLYDWQHHEDGQRGLDLLTGLIGWRRNDTGLHLRALWGLIGSAED